MTETLQGPTETSPDLPAIAAYTAHYDLPAEVAASEWRFVTEAERVKFRALADAVIMVAGLPHAGLAAELAKVQRGAQTLGMVVTRQARDLYAMHIDVSRGDLEAVAQRVLNSIPDVDDNPPAEQWNGTETGSQWLDRTRDALAGDGTATS
jgi:hypothetical protein